MEVYGLSLWTLTATLEATLLLRAWQGRFLSRFALFYSYIAFLFCSSAVALPLFLFQPHYYPSVFWFRFIVQILAEFAVLMEISDHIFSPYVAIRQLGRLLTFCIGMIFSLLYIYPSLMRHRPSDIIILDFVKRASVTKAIIIIFLLLAVRYYRLPLGKNISGMMIGFSIYLAVIVANLALAEKYGAALYGQALSVIGSLGYAVSLLIWTSALWRYQPVVAQNPKPPEERDRISGPLDHQLERFNTALTRLVRK